MHNKIINALALTGIFALVGCSDSSSDPTNLLGNLDNPEISSNSEGEEIPPAGEPDITSSETSTLPGESSPSEENTQPDGFSSATGETTEPDNTTSSNSGSQQTTSSESAQEQTYAFGWAKGNDPVPTKGCGKDLQLPKSGDFQFSWNFKGKNESRKIYIDIPDNYDKNKPYRLVFGMQCMNGSGSNVAKNEKYYGLMPLDNGKTTIFVAPDGQCFSNNCPPWGETDYTMFDELLAKLQNELCIDSSRVFSTGFSYGSMFTNGLSRNHQHVLRGVAVYETADINIWLPEVENKPIAWMGVHDMNDGLCKPEMGKSARNTALKNASAEGKDATLEQPEESYSSQHKCYDYKDVDERFPVRWCTDDAGHIWDHKDPGQWNSWVPAATWDFITQF